MHKARYIDPDVVKNIFSYNQDNGELCWKERSIGMCKTEHAMKSFNNKKAGKSVGTVRDNESGKTYLSVKFGGSHYLVHRICYVIMTGKQPEFIDHINGNGIDNRWANIRSVSLTENNRNMRLFKTNTTGIAGVGTGRNNRWQSCISINNRQINLGEYDTKAEAIAARRSAEKVLKYHKNHGENRPI